MKNKRLFSLVLAQELLHSRNPFPIDLDDAWEWLGCHDKKTAKRFLTQYFTADIDFAINAEPTTIRVIQTINSIRLADRAIAI